MKIGNREFQSKGHTYVMGILNVTPDSFSDGGRWNDRDRALKHVLPPSSACALFFQRGQGCTEEGLRYLPFWRRLYQ